MGKYLLAYRGGTMAETEEAQQAQLAAWGAWFGKLGDAVADPGAPFGPSAAISSSGAVSDAVSSGLTGYSVIEADSLDAATGHAKDCPLLADGGSIDVYESHSMM